MERTRDEGNTKGVRGNNKQGGYMAKAVIDGGWQKCALSRKPRSGTYECISHALWSYLIGGRILIKRTGAKYRYCT